MWYASEGAVSHVQPTGVFDLARHLTQGVEGAGLALAWVQEVLSVGSGGPEVNLRLNQDQRPETRLCQNSLHGILTQTLPTVSSENTVGPPHCCMGACQKP